MPDNDDAAQRLIDALLPKIAESLLPQLTAAVEKQIKGVLVDYSQAWVNEPSVKDYEALASRLRSASYMAGLNVALVNPPEFHAVPTEEVAPRAGLTVRRFASRTSAIAWLERELA